MPTPADRRTIRRLFIGYCGYEGVAGFAMMLTHWVTILPAYLAECGAPNTAVAVVAQAPQFLALFSMVITLRYLAWRRKRKRPAMLLLAVGHLLLVPLAILAVTMGIGSMWLVWGSLGIIFLRFIVISSAGPLHYGMMMEVTPLAVRGRLMGARLVAIGVMSVAGSLVAKHLLGLEGMVGFAWCFAGGALFMTLALGFYGFIHEPERDGDRTPRADQPRVIQQLRHLLSIPLFRRWMVAHLCLVGTMSGLGLATVHYRNALGGAAESVGMLSVVFSVAIMVAGPLFGWVTDRWGSHSTAVVFFAMYVLAFGLTAAVGTAAVAIPCFILLGIGHALQEMWFANYQAELFPDENRVGMLAGIRIMSAPMAFATAYGFGKLMDMQTAPALVFMLPFSLALVGLVMVIALPNPRRLDLTPPLSVDPAPTGPTP